MFRTRLRESPSSVTWRKLYDVISGEGELLDRFDLWGRDGQRRRLSTPCSEARARRRWTPRRGTVDCNKPRRPWPNCNSASPGHGHGFASAGKWNRPWRGFSMSKKSRRGWPWASRSGRGRRFVRPRRTPRSARAAPTQADAAGLRAFLELQHAALIEAEHDDGVFPL